ncbi:hypothetical protein [Lacticaseibacillus daqingensis]|uniref:hypothetical protein n=1 Tax=Lacticaseibacillus daqingensis TaxID=2486014 RepID=UPI000F769F7B|nr:hypothetical protein [Lacticaseibacillus daqingensis]
MTKRHSNSSTGWTWAVLILAAAAFTGFAWFVTQPTDALTMVSTGSFGVGLVALIWLLAYFDEAPSGRFSRFLIDTVFGLAIVALIYVYMIGFIVYPEFIGGAAGVVVVLAGLFAIRRPNRRQLRHNRNRLPIEAVKEAEE